MRASRRRVSASDEERFVVGLEGVGAERLERIAQLGFGVVVGLEPLGVDGAIFLELGLKTGLRGPRREPADSATPMASPTISVMPRVRGSMDISIA